MNKPNWLIRQQVLAAFDFEAAYLLFRDNDWKYALQSDYQVPNIEDLRYMAGYLVDRVLESDHDTWVTSGRLMCIKVGGGVTLLVSPKMSDTISLDSNDTDD